MHLVKKLINKLNKFLQKIVVEVKKQFKLIAKMSENNHNNKK